MLKSFKLDFMWSKNFQMYKLDLEKAEEADQMANIRWIIEKERIPEKQLLLHRLC